MDTQHTRPSPEALLAETDRKGRGKLKIFLGAAPGVGKTYEMLQNAQRALKDGTDVVIGIVETHGRVETQELTRDLPVIACKRVFYSNQHFDELDLDAILARKPQLVLVDELAHTNIPGSRHEKRYQDVEELLVAGINVYTALNVQHLESLNDVVEAISHVKVRETVPDTILDQADEIELVDLPPEELIERLHQGKVYVPEAATRALQHFFSRGNLMALREMAMRTAAQRVGAGMLKYMQARGIEGPWATQERIVVCISKSAMGERLVRLAKRMADQQKITWIAVHVDSARENYLEQDKTRVHEILSLAEELGGETAILSGYDVAAEIVAFAQSRNVSQILVGRSRVLPFPLNRLQRPMSDRLLASSDRFHIMVASRQSGEQTPKRQSVRQIVNRQAIRGEEGERRFNYMSYVEATGIVIVCALIAYALIPLLHTIHLPLVFLLAVLAVSIRRGVIAAIYACLLSFFALNFFFTTPMFGFSRTYQENVVILAFLLLLSIVTGNLATRVKAQVESIRVGSRINALLFDFSRRIAGAVGQNDLAWSVCEYVSQTLDCQTVVLRLDDQHQIQVLAGEAGRSGLIEIDKAAAQWALDHNQPAGRETGTLPGCRWYFIPIHAAERPRGVLGVTREDRRWYLSADQRRLLFAMRDQAGVALERMVLAEQMERTQLTAEREKLRSALLSSVSHDLRTPLVSIIGSTTTLIDMQGNITAAQRSELLITILEEAERLNRFVQNLLDMTRLSYGALLSNREWSDPRDVIGKALHRLKSRLAQHAVDLDIPWDFPWLFFDPVLMEQVLVNLLDNAAKYSPLGSQIYIRARMQEEQAVLQIIDEGDGIPEADRENVFNMFYRVEAEDTRAAGTGLGLAICRGFVEVMGGHIVARGGPGGRGTCMEITLPSGDQPPSLPEESAA